MKNASSWSSLAQASSPQSAAAGSSMKSAARDSFQAFKKQAKEKQDRVCCRIPFFLNFLFFFVFHTLDESFLRDARGNNSPNDCFHLTCV